MKKMLVIIAGILMIGAILFLVLGYTRQFELFKFTSVSLDGHRFIGPIFNVNITNYSYIAEHFTTYIIISSSMFISSVICVVTRVVLDFIEKMSISKETTE